MDRRLRLGQAGDYLRTGDARGLLLHAGKLIYSESVGIGIRRDLTAAPDRLAGPANHEIRRATDSDVQTLVDAERGDASDADELWQRRLRRHVVASFGVDSCYVADADDMGPCFMQYLFFQHDNEMIQATFPGLYPVLEPDEAMVEFLYVAPEARRAGFATECMILVTDEARRRGADSVISFIRPDGKGAILACQKAGFRIDSVRRSRYRFLRQTITFEARPDDMSENLSDLLTDRSS